MYCIFINRIITIAIISVLALAAPEVFCQDAGGDLGGGAGIFRPKNPETRTRRSTRGRSGTASRPGTGVVSAEVEEKVEELLEKGNSARDASSFGEAEKAYRSALTLKAREDRAAYGLGNIFVDQQRWVDAERAYRQATQINGRNAEAYLALSYVLIQPRSDGEDARRLTQAEGAARLAIKIEPQNAIAYDRLGLALESRSILSSETEQAYRRALELDPTLAVAYVNLARFLRKTNRAQEAENYYRRATETAQDAPTLVLIARALQSELLFDQSEALLKRALELDPKDPQALFLMGRLLVVQKKYHEAEPYLKTVIQVSPRSFSPYYILGSAYLRMDRPAEAEQIYNTAAGFASAADRKLLAGSYGLAGVGDVFMRTGRVSDAVRVYERALTLDPGNAQLQSKVAEARSKRKQ